MINIFCIRPKGFNIGNDIIFLALRHFIYKSFRQVVNLISLPAVSRYESQAKAGLTARIIHEINQYGHGVIVGGGNLYENGELDVDTNALLQLEPPMMLFSLSSGRIYNRVDNLVHRTDAMPPAVIAALNTKASFSMTRDNRTLEYLKNLGCKNAVCGGCPTIHLNHMLQEIPLPQLPVNEQPQVLISVRSPALMNISLRHQVAVRRDILSIIDILRSKGIRNIRLLCHDHRDIPFASSMGEVDYVYTGDAYVYLAMLKSSNLNISYRLHSILPCMALGTPTIPITYDERAISLLETIGMKDWQVNMISCNDVPSAVTNAYNNLELYDNLNTKSLPVRHRLYDTISNVFEDFALSVMCFKDPERMDNDA